MRRDGDRLVAETPERGYEVFVSEYVDEDPYFQARSPYLVGPADRSLAVSTGRRWSVDEVAAHMQRSRDEILAERSVSVGELAECYEGMHAVMARNTVYDPRDDRVVSPVSRVWNNGWNGNVLFCWDTYFAALMAGIDCKPFAFANAVEATREIRKRGFVPNFFSGGVRGPSEDRSQPPVGARTVWQLYRRWGEAWLLAETFDDLLRWDRWWDAHRRSEGYLVWGSNAYVDSAGEHKRSSGTLEAAVLESGFDNSPMYGHARFDEEHEVMRLADAGLAGMYVMDCRCLAEMARVLGREEESELVAGTRLVAMTLSV